jgi:hypothetical protein
MEEVLDNCMWMDTAWDSHLCQWAMKRFGIYKALVQLKYFGWSCDFEAEEIDQISDQSYEEAWRDLDVLCGGFFSGPTRPCANAHQGGDVLPGKKFLYVGEHFPSECFREWGFRGVHLPVAAGRGRPGAGSCPTGAWNLRQMGAVPSPDEVPWPRTLTGAVELWPDGETNEVAFDLVILDQTPKKSELVQGYLAFFLRHLRSGGALVVKLSSLPKCKALTPLWHLVRIFGCGSVRLRKPGLGPDVHRSSFYIICRNFPGAGVASLRSLSEVSHALLQYTSRDVEGGGLDLPPMPTCIPTSPIVLTRSFCALLEAFSRDAKPIWTKQYLALRSNLLVLSAQTASPPTQLLLDETSLKRRKSRQTGDSTAVKRSKLVRAPRTWSACLSSLSMRPGIENAPIFLILFLWIAVNFFLF